MNTKTRSQEHGTEQRLAAGLGWFSIGLGLGELLAPSSVARLIGAPNEQRVRNVLRTYGVREIVAGIGILRQPASEAWVWKRVAGDLMDLASLGSAMASPHANRARLAAATAAVLGVTAVDVYCGQQLNSRSTETSPKHPDRILKTIIIDRPPEELYQFWCDLNNMPRFMQGLVSVQVLGGDRSHWTMRLGDKTIEWDAEIVQEEPNRMIAWRATRDDSMEYRASVRFEPAPGRRGTMVRWELQHSGSGVLSSLMTKLSAPAISLKMETDLRRLKQLMETGEIIRSDATIHTGMHAAQPPSRSPQPTMSH